MDSPFLDVLFCCKKVIAGMLSLALVAGAVPASVGGFLTGGTAIVASAATEVASGDCGTTGHQTEVTWTLDSDGVLTISGTGPMASYSQKNMPWENYRKDKTPKITKIVVEPGITKIGDYAFYNCTSLNKVTIPNTVTSIGASSFKWCYLLDSVYIPNSVISIYSSAFNGCQNLKTVNFEDRIASSLSIGSGCFVSCNELATITPSGLMYSSGGKTYSLSEDALRSGNITILPNVTLALVPAVEATCKTNGNSAYYEGSNGKYYTLINNEYVEIEPDSWIIPATGHTYDETSPMWTWIRNGDTYDVSVKFKCKNCGDIVTPEETPTLTITENDGIKTFTASVTYNIIEYQSTKNESTSYTITINGNEKQYKYGTQVKAVANVPAGQYFEGWYETGTDNKISGSKTYYFYATRNMNIEPRYSDNIVTAQPVLTMNISDREDIGNGKNKVSFTYDWELPDGYTLEKAAIVRSYEVAEPNISTSDTNVHYTALTNARGTYRINLTMGTVSAAKTLRVCGYIKYKDNNGESHEAYTDVLTSAPLNQ
ncbi:leucine-rich repeat domain-containing protein [Ruminococcus albus]|nr:leucine-rich repeat domain-containing protein [Ruminococcus albus]